MANGSEDDSLTKRMKEESVLLIAASILAARKLGQYDVRRSPVTESAISEAITLADLILQKIEARPRMRHFTLNSVV
jgi:hypothetical protein